MSTSARRNEATRRSVASQSAIVLKLSTNQRSDCCTWVKAPAATINPPSVISPPKKPGDGDENRRDDREPSIAGRDPGQARQRR